VGDHIRIGMGCEGSARCQGANRPPDQQLWSWSIRYGSNRAGRMAVTEHIPGLSAMSPVPTLAAGARVMPTRAWLLVAARLDQGRDRWIAWSFYARSPWVWNVWGCMPPSGGVERPRRKERFARLIQRRGRDLGGPTVRAASGGNLKPARLPPRVVRHDRRWSYHGPSGPWLALVASFTCVTGPRRRRPFLRAVAAVATATPGWAASCPPPPPAARWSGCRGRPAGAAGR